MALQNLTMRLILNNMPPTTVMTGNVTRVISNSISYAFQFRSMGGIEHEGRMLSWQATRMAPTLSRFTAGAVAAAQSATGVFPDIVESIDRHHFAYAR